MTVTKTVCDVCGKEPTLPVHHNYRREHDGVESYTAHDTTDLCLTHAVYVLQQFWNNNYHVTPKTAEQVSAELLRAPYKLESERKEKL